MHRAIAAGLWIYKAARYLLGRDDLRPGNGNIVREVALQKQSTEQTLSRRQQESIPVFILSGGRSLRWHPAARTAMRVAIRPDWRWLRLFPRQHSL
jgi:hypothetical protein